MENMDKQVRLYYLADETVALIQDALEQSEDTHNNRSGEPEDEEDLLATSYSRIQRILLHQQKKHELVPGSEDA